MESPRASPGRETAAVLRAGLLAALALIALWLFADEILLTFFAVLIACGLRGSASAAGRRLRLPLAAAAALLFLLLLLLLAGLGVVLGPRVAGQVRALGEALQTQWANLKGLLGQSSFGRLLLAQLPSGGGHVPALHVAGATLGGLGTAVVVIATALYLASSPDIYLRGAAHLMPPHRRARVTATLIEAGRTLRLWLLGQLIAMLTVGVLATAGLFLVGVPLPIALGLIGGVLTFVPYFGAIAAAIPAVLLGLSRGPEVAVWALGVFTLCHLVEGYVVSPLVQRRLVEVPPALIVLALTFAGAAFGPLGIVLGTPLAAVGLVFVRRLYVNDVLDDRTV